MTALLASAWGAPAIATACLAAVAAGAGLGATWDRITAALTAIRTTPNGSHRR